MCVQELARLQEGVKGEIEGYRQQLSALRNEQAPWEAQLAEVNSRVSVASAERDLLLKKQANAEKRLKVSLPPKLLRIVVSQVTRILQQPGLCRQRSG